jgi:hypothetical protein
MSSRGYAARTPGTGENIGTVGWTTLVEQTAIKVPQGVVTTAPAGFIKIASTYATGGTDHPLEQTSASAAVTISSGSTTSVTFTAEFGFGVPTGLLLVLNAASNASNQYEVFKITDWNATTHVATLNRALPASLTASDPYTLLIDTYGYGNLLIKTEYSTTTNTADLYSSFYDEPRDLASTPGKRAPIRYFDILTTPENTGISTNVTQSTYFHGTTRTVVCAGALGAKIRLNAVSAGSVSLWAAAV